jgi:hypothetical protein
MNSPDIGNKSIPAPNHSLDVLRFRALIAESSSEQKDRLRKIRIFDKRIGPDFLQQLILLDKLTRVSDEHDQDLSSLARERDHFTGARENALGQFETVRTKFVVQSVVMRHQSL